MNKPKASVIGSGFGGLASALRLQSLGMDVTIYEKRDMPGGRAYVYKEKGFTFDAGPTVITAPECLEELFQIHGRKMCDYVQLMPVTPFYRLFWEDGKTFDYGGSLEDTLEQIKNIEPSDVEGYKNFLNYSKEVYHEGYEKLAAKAFLKWTSMLKVAPQLIKLRADRSVYSTVSRYIRNDHLRQAFSFHSLLVGGNPFSTSSIYTLIHYLERNGGVYFPKGGTGALIQALVRLFQENGGRLILNAEVDEVLTTENKVQAIRLKDKTQHPCDLVVSNADVVHTYKNLFKSHPEAHFKTKQLTQMRQSMSLFLIYFGTNKKYPNLAHHNVIFGPRYQGLLKEIFGGAKLPKDFSLYLHRPTESDPNLAPEGHESFYVLSPVAHLGHLNIDWKTEGPKYAQSILDYLEERYMPGLKESLVVQKIFTPQDFSQQLNSHLGSAFSLEPVLHQSAYFRVHNKDNKIKGLYFAGAGTHPGAGVPGVVSSAKATAEVISSDYAKVLQ